MIKYCDQLFRCDSVGQHLAYAVGMSITAVIGATFPH